MSNAKQRWVMPEAMIDAKLRWEKLRGNFWYKAEMNDAKAEWIMQSRNEWRQAEMCDAKQWWVIQNGKWKAEMSGESKWKNMMQSSVMSDPKRKWVMQSSDEYNIVTKKLIISKEYRMKNWTINELMNM